MKTKFLTLTLGLATLVSFGCESTTTTNVNLRNTNLDNKAIVVNNNSNMVVNTSNTNRTMNSNVNRADYDKNKTDYEKEKGESKIGSGANDSWIWFKTRAALLTTAGIRESTVNVDVDNNVVTLRGTVENAAQKTKAEEVAKGIEGVTKVTNQLKVAANDSMTNQAVNGNSKTSNANTKNK